MEEPFSLIPAKYEPRRIRKKQKIFLTLMKQKGRLQKGEVRDASKPSPHIAKGRITHPTLGGLGRPIAAFIQFGSVTLPSICPDKLTELQRLEQLAE